MKKPVIYIDSQRAHNLDREITLQKIYYRPEGYYQIAEKMQDACKKAGYEFTLAIIKNWLNKQALYQIHKPRPTFIQYASFNNIRTLNKVHQSDTTPMPHDKVSNQTYKYRGVIKDIATRYRHSFALTDKTAMQMAREIQKIYDNPNCPLSWPKVLIMDKRTEYMGECRDLFLKYGVRIQYAKSKRSVAIAEQDHQEFEKHAFFRQDAMDLHLPLTDRSRE